MDSNTTLSLTVTSTQLSLLWYFTRITSYTDTLPPWINSIRN